MSQSDAFNAGRQLGAQITREQMQAMMNQIMQQGASPDMIYVSNQMAAQMKNQLYTRPGRVIPVDGGDQPVTRAPSCSPILDELWPDAPRKPDIQFYESNWGTFNPGATIPATFASIHMDTARKVKVGNSLLSGILGGAFGGLFGK